MAATTGIVVAAGTGERLQSHTAKAFALLAGESLLVHAVRGLASCADVDHVVAVVNDEDRDRAARALDEAGLEDVILCAGGPSRAQSVMRGLEGCPEGTTTVAVHDAARPLVTAQLTARTLAALTGPWSAVAPGVPQVDTLKLVDEDGETIVRTVDRRGLYGVQTPQVFARHTLVDMHARMDPDAATDDLELVERAGGRVRLVPGDRVNLKITYPEDLAFAEALLAHGRGWRVRAGDVGGAR